MKVRNQALYASLYNLTKVALEAICEIDVKYFDFETAWTRSSDNSFVRHQIRKPYIGLVLHDIRSQLEDSNEYSVFSNALSSDSTLAAQVDELVGTSLGLMRLEKITIASWVISEFIKNGKVEKLLKAVFNPVYKRIETFLYSSHIEFEILAPIAGFSMDDNKIRLSGNHTIEKLSDSEISNILKMGIRLGVEMGDTGTQFNIQEYAIRSVYKLQKQIGNIENRENDELFKSISEGLNQQKIIDTLRIFKKGRIKQITSIKKSKSIFQFGTSYMHDTPFIGYSKDDFVLMESEVNEFRKFYNRTLKVNTSDNKYLEVCIRRFSQSNERINIEDKIIDLMISAEAIFLTSGGNFQGELKYRLSHRAAMFVGSVSAEQLYIFEFMRKAYDVRSDIVHGSNPRLPPRHDGSNYENLSEFCADLEQYLRIAIRNVIDSTVRSRKKSKMIDWNKIIFPSH